MIKVSVVVPIYNVERYLEESLRSVVNQTLQELQIILVDDGSSDKSGLIAEEWRRRDSRIQVIHQTNQGYGCAVNAGLAWIMHEAESATQNLPLNFELAAFFCAWKKAIRTPAIKNIK